MKCMVTGATGFIGNRLVEELINLGNEVNILARSQEKANQLYGNTMTFFNGDLLNTDVILKATRNCDVIFHLAAFANIWSKDKMLAYKTNVTGTKNILEASLQNKVKKVVFTSSAGVFPPSENGEDIDQRTVSRSLGMSERKLQSGLKEEGTSFQTILDWVRERKALHLLTIDGKPVSDVALQLGFREISSFTRAFKRWTGKPPRDYLKQGR